MHHFEMNKRARAALGSVLAFLSGVSAFAQDTASQHSVSQHAEDASLAWGPCPEFMPAGCALAVLHGDPSKRNADVFLKVPAGSSLPLHWHTSAERMVVIAGELRVAYEGQEPAVLKPGTYAYGPPGRPHAGACVSASPCVLFIAFEDPVDAVAGTGR